MKHSTAKQTTILQLICILFPLLLTGCPWPEDEDHFRYTLHLTRMRTGSIEYLSYPSQLPSPLDLNLGTYSFTLAKGDTTPVSCVPQAEIPFALIWRNGSYHDTLHYLMPIEPEIHLNDIEISDDELIHLPESAEYVLAVQFGDSENLASHSVSTSPSLKEYEEYSIVIRGTGFQHSYVEPNYTTAIRDTLTTLPTGDTLTFSYSRTSWYRDLIDRKVYDTNAQLTIEVSGEVLISETRVIIDPDE